MSPRESGVTERSFARGSAPEHGSPLRAPFHLVSAREELQHFQGRRGVRYFAVPDEEQASRQKAQDMLAGEIELNGERHKVPPGFNWLQNPSRDLEWLILLHKFYHGVGLAQLHVETGDPRCGARWVELVDSWIDQVPLDFLPGDVTGRRLQSWIGAHLGFVVERPSPAVTPELHRKFLRSIRDQAAYLSQHLAPARNHRTIELAALFQVAVVFPELNESRSWLTLAIELLAQSSRDDFLEDGVHCELSTDYHCLVLKNYLNVVRLARLNAIELPATLHEGIRGALKFALHVHRPDGEIPALSDGDSRSFLALIAQGAELYPDLPEAPQLRYVATGGREGRAPAGRLAPFAASGYVTLRSGWGENGVPFRDEQFLVLDAGPFGAGNHGHFDALSFELAAFGQALIVDPGRYTYDESGEVNWRARFRVTSAHNTVVVDGKNQARYEAREGSPRAKLRLRGPAAEATLTTCLEGDALDCLRAAVKGQGYEAMHERTIVFVHQSGRMPYWVVADTLRSGTVHEYDQYFHLSGLAQGQVQVHAAGEVACVVSPHLVLASASCTARSLTIEEGFVSRTYGFKRPAPVVRISARGANLELYTVLVPHGSAELAQAPTTQLTVSPLPAGGARLEVEISSPGGNLRDVLQLPATGLPEILAP